ncbi:family 10 glycosylhydrolase [Desulfococcaceae bacterium HSG7]|nr:family 10 glycosylhydrolase [Desulfococcaceae bacterium HSG7]
MPKHYIAIRLDPGRLYEIIKDGNPGETLEAKINRVANQVVNDSATAGFNTIFVIAYSPKFGAYYQTDHELTSTENGYGVTDFLNVLIKTAHKKKMEVVASFHINNYFDVWEEKELWREKMANKSDYIFGDRARPLSPGNPEYRNWFAGLLADFLERHPDIDGLEAFEGYVDYEGPDNADYNAQATKAFLALHPLSELGRNSEAWLKFRADTLTQLHQILFDVARGKQKKSFVVQTWTAREDGSLWTAKEIRNTFGFDFHEIVSRDDPQSAPDGVVVQVIAQQWKHLYRNKPETENIFVPKWTATAGKTARQQLKIPENSRFMIHIELTDFNYEGAEKPPPISLEIFKETLKNALSVANDITIYDYVFMRKAKENQNENAFNEIKNIILSFGD